MGVTGSPKPLNHQGLWFTCEAVGDTSVPEQENRNRSAHRHGNVSKAGALIRARSFGKDPNPRKLSGLAPLRCSHVGDAVYRLRRSRTKPDRNYLKHNSMECLSCMKSLKSLLAGSVFARYHSQRHAGTARGASSERGLHLWVHHFRV